MTVFDCRSRLYANLIVLTLIAVFAAMNPQKAFSLADCGTAKLTIAAGPNGCDVQFGLSTQYDTAVETSVALISTGLVVEMHRGLSDNNLWYTVGKLNGMSVIWGPARPIGVTGSWPQVTMTDDGYLIELHSNLQSRANSNLYYRLGKLNPSGDQNQTIQWLTSGFEYWEGGFHASLSMKIIHGVYTIVGVSESNNTNPFLTSVPMYYRVGHISPASGNYSITWDSGAAGQYYTTGVNPHIAINASGQVVEVHQTASDESFVHYIRGTLSGGLVQFAADQPRYNSNVTRPSVALNDNGFVTEVHDDSGSLGRMVGKLNADGTTIDWSSTFVFDPEAGTYPAISTNGAYVIQTHENTSGVLFSTSAIRDRNNWMGDMLSSIGSQPLGQIVFPGSHDAGMYCDTLGKTQDLNLYDQLQAGVRYFDLRVIYGNPQRIVHADKSETLAFVCDPVAQVMGDVKKFMGENNNEHKEVVVLKFSHFLGFGPCGPTNDQYETLRETIAQNVGPWVYTANVHPAEVPLNNILGNKPDKGKVIVVVDGDWAAPQCGQQEAGFYVYKDWCSGASECTSTPNPSQGEFNVYDQYSSTTNYNTMKTDQLQKFAGYNGKMETDPNVLCDLFLLSWTLTPGGIDFSTPVSVLSAPANRALGAEMNNVSQNQFGFIPNILYVDYGERARVTDAAILMTQRFNP